MHQYKHESKYSINEILNNTNVELYLKNLESSIHKDIDIYHFSFQKLIVNILFCIYLFKSKINKKIYKFLIGGLIFILIKNELNKNKVNVLIEKNNNKYNIIKIIKTKKNNTSAVLTVIKYLLFITNFNIKKIHNSAGICYINQPYTNLVYRCPNNFNFPNKFILLLNHTINFMTTDFYIILMYIKLMSKYKIFSVELLSLYIYILINKF